jgi:protein SCO1
VVVMFFASCEYACSVLVNDLKRIEAALPKDTRARTGFLLISFDTVRDAPEVLRAFRQRMELPEERWTLVTGRPDDVRELAALLGVRYQQDTRGQFAHSNLLTVLNDGEVIHQHTGLNRPVDKVVRAIVGCPQ